MARLTDERLGFLLLHPAQVGITDGRVMAQEIAERRAADPTDEEREALRWAVEMAATAPLNSVGTMKQQRALAVLDKLLARGGR